jgi:hypothetical protein
MSKDTEQVEHIEPAPGPWSALEDKDRSFIFWRYQNPYGTCHLFSIPIGQYKQQEATARLVRAAPELLDIVKRLVAYYETNETRP